MKEVVSDNFLSYLWTPQILTSRRVSAVMYTANALRNTQWLNTRMHSTAPWSFWNSMRRGCNQRCSDHKPDFEYRVRPFPMPPLGEEIMFQPSLPQRTLKENNHLQTSFPSFPNYPMDPWWDWAFVSAGGRARGRLLPPEQERTSCITTCSAAGLHVQAMWMSLVCNFIQNLSLLIAFKPR